MSLLDQIVQNQTGPRIMREEHNLGNIQIGTSFDASMNEQIDNIMNRWDEAEYGVSREVAIERLKASDTPEKRAKWVTDMTQRAIKRANLYVKDGKVAMFAAGELPWHGLGTLFDKPLSDSKEAIHYAGQDWTVSKVPHSYQWNGATKDVNDCYSIVRTDTGAHLGSVGPKYQPIQNSDAFAFLDGVLAEWGAKYETAGALYEGERVWILAHMPDQGFTINGGDRLEQYVLFTNPHDGSGAAVCYPTSVRVVCANTLRVSGKDSSKGLRIRHTGNVKDKIRKAQKALGLAVTGFQQFHESAEQLYHKPCDIGVYAHDVLDACMQVTQAQANMGADALAAAMQVDAANRELETKRIQRQIDRRQNVLQDIIGRYESERNGFGSIRGTAWAAFNAVTEHADHNKMGRQAKNAVTARSRRLESVLDGDADVMKQVALEKALAY